MPKSKRKDTKVLQVNGSSPAAAAKKSVVADDFVMTISDSDDDVPILDEDEDEDSADEAPKPASPSPEPEETRGKKRKRVVEKAVVEKKKDVDDGGLDSDFEFQTGDLGDGVGEYDGWGFEGAKAAMKDSKKGVDIDEIIRRRNSKKQADAEAGDEEEEDEDESSDAEGQGFDEDDEDVAEDAFGMGAESEDDEAADSDASNGSDGEGEENEDSDDESSIASDVAHPDDLASDDEQSETEDAAEAAKKAAFFAPEDEITFNPDPSASFQNMNLSRPILRGLANVGFTTPTLIQQKAIPVALLGKDVVGGAQTGSGKTAAFMVPILERLLYRPKKVPTTRVLILCPTRELAMQAHSVAVKLAAYTDIKFALAVGGLSLKVQEAELKKRPDVVFATPGRFIDHMRNSQGFGVETIEIVVMDEADRMLEDGFADELNEIINTIPKSRQTMLFSATMTDSVDKLVRLSLNRPVRLMVDSKKSTVRGLVQEFVRIRPQREKHKLAMLLHICKELISTRCIVFFRSKVFAHKVRIVFGLFGMKAAELHGSLTQEQRVKAVESFRDGAVDFLLATDLASRGLDIKNVDCVINFEAPQSHEIYTHRVGRTARAGRSGRAITLAAETDRKVVKTAVRAAQAQNAKVVSRVLDTDKVNAVNEKLVSLEQEIEEILKEEKAEKEIQNMEMQIRRTENLVKHEDEIKGRPKRTWFETQRDKAEAKKISKAELNGVSLPEKKLPMSGKKRKREELKTEKAYKKTKQDRAEKSGRGGVKAANKRGGGGKKGKGKGKGKGRK
ncbi:P-loop containing nucleoside triphosphate hydrolase protein [Sphaerosporella brunnea]|uniref:RNA helicase n=1 Tax=Sphaerosporella brunnea TaxID=1250544 RepID=A0A5J5F9L1_9PEZI|nr:P-loop containing nucleoside triphosphate hydrolase protein [Sphaerosporella brunnea]